MKIAENSAERDDTLLHTVISVRMKGNSSEIRGSFADEAILDFAFRVHDDHGQKRSLNVGTPSTGRLRC